MIGYHDQGESVVFFIKTDGMVAYTGLVDCYKTEEQNAIKMVLEKEPDAIIVEGFGRGNLPAGMMPAIKKAVKKGIFVVISTRASSGRVLDSTVFPGSVAQCLESGCLLAGETTTAKARLLLMYVLSQKEAIQLKKEDPERFFAYVQECLDPVLTNRLFG